MAAADSSINARAASRPDGAGAEQADNSIRRTKAITNINPSLKFQTVREDREFTLKAEALPVRDEEGDARIRTDDVAAALARHGVNATARVVTHQPADAHQILRQASIFGADLI